MLNAVAESAIPNRDQRHPRVDKHLVRVMRVVVLLAKRSEPPLVARAPVDFHHVRADFSVLAALQHAARFFFPFRDPREKFLF